MVISFAFYGDFLYLNPRYNHFWAQSDRMCLALGFVENGLNFFKPQICNLGTSDGTIGVEFPILYYISAVFMKLFNSESPFFVRFFSLLSSIIGLCYIYNISRIYGVSIFGSFSIIIMIFFSPIFFFYQANFNPNHLAFGLSAIALNQLYKYYRNQQFDFLLIFHLFGVLASLVKTSYGLYYISGNIFIYFTSKYENKEILYKILLNVTGFLIILFYFIYNQYLYRIYGSMFLMETAAFDNIFQFIWESGQILSFWLTEMLFLWQWLLIILLFLFIGVHSGLKLSRNKFIISISIIAGSFSVFYLMGKQYRVHDYYIIDIFYLPMLLLMILLLRKFELIVKNKIVLTNIAIIVCVFSAISGNIFFENRKILRMDNRSDFISVDFEGGNKILDSLKISKKEKLIVFDGFCPDGILLLLRRKGITTNSLDSIEILNWHKKGFNYLILENLTIINYPPCIEQLKPISNLYYKNDKFSIYKLNFNL